MNRIGVTNNIDIDQLIGAGCIVTSADKRTTDIYSAFEISAEFPQDSTSKYEEIYAIEVEVITTPSGKVFHYYDERQYPAQIFYSTN